MSQRVIPILVSKQCYKIMKPRSRRLWVAIVRVILSHEDEHIVGKLVERITLHVQRLLLSRNAGVIFVAHTKGSS